MAASAGTVTLNLDANSVKLLRELQKAQTNSRRTANTMAADFQRAFSRIAKASAVAATAIAGSAVAIYRSQSNVLDSLGKTSDALGVQTERLQALQHVANLTGTGAESLSTNLERMQRRLGEIVRRGGGAEKALQDIGISIKDIINLSADKQLEEISKAMSSVENAAVRASIANDLFGRDGVRMLKLMEQLKNEGLDPVVEQLNNLGASISRIDAARLERANDALTEARQVATGVFQRLAVNMSDFVHYFATAFTDMAANSDMLGDHIDRMFDRMILGAIGVYESIGTAMSPIVNITKFLWNAFNALPTWAKEIGILGALFLGKTSGRVLIAAVAGLSWSLKSAEEQMNKFLQQEGIDPSMFGPVSGQDVSVLDMFPGFGDPNWETDIEENASKLRELFNQIVSDRKKFAEEYESIVTPPMLNIMGDDGTPGELEGIEEYMRSLEEGAIRIMEKNRTATENAVRDLNEFWLIVQQVGEDRLSELGVNIDQVYERLLDNISKTLPQIEQKTSATAAFIESAMSQAAKSIQGAFAGFLFDPFRDGLKGMAKGFIDTIRRMIAEMMAFQAIQSLAGMGGPIGSFFSRALPSRDSGGRGVAGQPYMIGRGAQPEIFIPDSAGTFIPNADKMGGTTLNITVDARDEGAEARIRDMINREMAPQIIAAAKGSTVAALRRPRFA